MAEPVAKKAATPVAAPVPAKSEKRDKKREKAPSRPVIDPGVRKEKQRAKAAEKVERRKARAAAAEAKQKKSKRRDEGTVSGSRLKATPSQPRLPEDDVEDRPAPRAAAGRRPAAAAAPARRGMPKAVIGVLAVLLIAGAVALVLAQK